MLRIGIAGLYDKRHLRVSLATRRHVFYIDLNIRRTHKEQAFLTIGISCYSTVGAVMTPRPKNSAIVPNLSLLRCKAS